MSDPGQRLSVGKTIAADLAVLDGAGRGFVAVVATMITRAGFHAVVMYRLAAAGQRGGALGRIFARLLRRMNIMINACDIDPKASIGPGLKLSHPMGIVIGPARIGSNVMILQNTTIGMRRFEDDEHSPTSYPDIGDNVVICSGAAILGGVRIGNKVNIGANSVVLHDVPDHCTAVGAPAKILSKTISIPGDTRI
jgi:serine O-acetyltransferase